MRPKPPSASWRCGSLRTSSLLTTEKPIAGSSSKRLLQQQLEVDALAAHEHALEGAMHQVHQGFAEPQRHQRANHQAREHAEAHPCAKYLWPADSPIHATPGL